MSKNSELLAKFVAYCEDNPEQRFWQALRNWSGYPFILVSELPPYMIHEYCAGYVLPLTYTFYFEAAPAPTPEEPAS